MIVGVLAWRPWLILLVPGAKAYASLAVLLAAGLTLQAKELGRPARIAVNTAILLFGFLLGTRAPDPVATDPGFTNVDLTLRAIGLAACAIAMFRPAFGLITISVYSWTTVNLKMAYLGLPVDGGGDWGPVSDFGVFLLSMLVLTRAINSAVGRLRPGWVKEGTLPRQTSEALVLVAAAPHLANYAHSAFEKTMLDGGPLSWLLQNPTHWLILNSQTLGTSPIGSLPWFDQIGTLFKLGDVSLNLLTIVSQ